MRLHTLQILLALLLTNSASASTDLARAALDRTAEKVTYDGAYRSIAYPNGDVPAHIGVCTDVVIRSLRVLDIDLQQLVHEDMLENFALYPQNWGLKKPDSNIDHRRVPNLETFLARHGAALPISEQASDYLPGDIVTWRLAGRLPHIGIVGEERVPGTRRHYIIHNVGRGPKQEDVLFRYQLHRHFRYAVSAASRSAK